MAPMTSAPSKAPAAGRQPGETNMTGAEFKAALKAAGYTQAAFALEMGVHRQTIGKQAEADRVDRMWVYALAGLLAAKSTGAVMSIVDKLDAN